MLSHSERLILMALIVDVFESTKLEYKIVCALSCSIRFLVDSPNADTEDRFVSIQDNGDIWLQYPSGIIEYKFRNEDDFKSWLDESTFGKGVDREFQNALLKKA